MEMNTGVCTKLNRSFWNGIAEQISMEREDLSSQKTGYEQPAAQQSSLIGLVFYNTRVLLICFDKNDAKLCEGLDVYHPKSSP